MNINLSVCEIEDIINAFDIAKGECSYFESKFSNFIKKFNDNGIEFEKFGWYKVRKNISLIEMTIFKTFQNHIKSYNKPNKEKVLNTPIKELLKEYKLDELDKVEFIMDIEEKLKLYYISIDSFNECETFSDLARILITFPL